MLPNPWGAERYYFDRCKRLEVWYHEAMPTNKNQGKPSILAKWA
jgi:hypothetical protein